MSGRRQLISDECRVVLQREWGVESAMTIFAHEEYNVFGRISDVAQDGVVDGLSWYGQASVTGSRRLRFGDLFDTSM